MNINIEHLTIELTGEEFWSIAFYIRQSLISEVKKHWVNYQDSWERNEKQRLKILKCMFEKLGREDVYINMFDEIQIIFSNHNKNKDTK